MVGLSRGLASLVVAFAVFVALYLFVMPQSCIDLGGVPSWERCTTIIHRPAFSLEDWGLGSQFNGLIPVVPGVLAGYAAWRLQASRSRQDD